MIELVEVIKLNRHKWGEGRKYGIEIKGKNAWLYKIVTKVDVE